MSLRQAFFVSVSLLAVVAASHVPVLAQQPGPVQDEAPMLGTWRMNAAKSRYMPGPPPVSETRTFERDREGILGTVQRRLADGRTENIRYRANYSREYPVSGTEAYDAVIFKRIDMYTSEAVLSHAGRVYGTARRVIARDGRTMTITFRGEQSNGTAVHNVVLYDKVP
jgi:hypothetical protein